MNRKHSVNKSLSEVWQDFIQAEQKLGSKLGEKFKTAAFGKYDQRILTLHFSDEDSLKAAKALFDKLKKKLPGDFKPCDRIDFKLGDVPMLQVRKFINTPEPKLANPLQVLNRHEFGDNGKDKELPLPMLQAAVRAEKTCSSVYQKLAERTRRLATDTIAVSFDWRLRVGGTRGFRELLFPVFHPVFGVPYIPAASLKGAARAWARKNGESTVEINKILGMLDGKIAKAAKVEFLDAFPTKACLSVDVATPQWSWQNDRVSYKPVPHNFLSLEQPTFLMGLRATQPQYTEHVAIVKTWLNNALVGGIGSRTSSGYGRALGASVNVGFNCSYDFELWTQGMFGGEQKVEFRPTALRGILRYWFRAVALSLYSPQNVQILEEEFFGALSKQGSLSLRISFNPSDIKDPYKYSGRIYLSAANEQQLNLFSRLLLLSTHLGGVGRGSRRPLHWLDGRMRGCHWSLEGDDLPFKLDNQQWTGFFEELKLAFASVRSPVGSFCSDPGGQKAGRQQDTLDGNAQVWLLPSIGQLPPEKVKAWQGDNVRGKALQLLYGNEKFKGKNTKGVGNENVGGTLGTPSFVWIKSIFPDKSQPYEVVTIFGVNNSDRVALAKALQKERAILVFGQMPPQYP